MTNINIILKGNELTLEVRFENIKDENVKGYIIQKLPSYLEKNGTSSVARYRTVHYLPTQNSMQMKALIVIKYAHYCLKTLLLIAFI